MRTRAGIILQARFSSTRLPGKALEPIGGCSMVERCLRRLVAGGVAHVVLATTTLFEDDALAVIAGKLGVPVFRGEVDDVLGRYVGAAEAFDLDPIIRATGDNPAVDIQAPGRVLAALRSTGADFVIEDNLPYGACVEGMTRSALSHAHMAAESAHDREHVTSFIKRRRDLFNVVYTQAPAPLARPSLHLSVDTREDLDWLRELYFRAGSSEPSLSQLIAAAGRSSHRKAA
jgi:spore coat polysaccharide biosynthesis protein SpsF (cytidylyltransferase family)